MKQDYKTNPADVGHRVQQDEGMEELNLRQPYAAEAQLATPDWVAAAHLPHVHGGKTTDLVTVHSALMFFLAPPVTSACHCGG